MATFIRALKALVPLFLPLFVLILFSAGPCFGSFESSLVGIKSKVTGIILPLVSVVGLSIAAMSLFTGSPNAKQHMVYAIIGCLFGFGAQAIVDFIAQTVR